MNCRSLYSLGNNKFGQLGIGTGEKQISPKLVPLPEVVSVNAGAYHAIARARDGKLFSWGRNGSGQLGLGYTSNFIASPEEIKEIPEHVTEICCGGDFSVVVDSEGSLWIWGNISMETHVTPKKIEHPEYFIAAASGLEGFLGLTKNGDVYSWGGYYSSGSLEHKKIIFPENSGPAQCIVAGQDQYAVVTKEGKTLTWGTVSQLGRPGKGYTNVDFIPEFEAAIPETANDQKWKIMQWLFLGKISFRSHFEKIPDEIIFHIFLLLDSESWINAPGLQFFLEKSPKISKNKCLIS